MARWKESLSKFDATVQYVPGKDDMGAIVMSRYAYLACKAINYASFLVSTESYRERKGIMEQELAEGKVVVCRDFLNTPGNPGRCVWGAEGCHAFVSFRPRGSLW